MNIMNSLNENEITLLNSEDPSERRSAVEELISREMDEEAVKIVCGMLADPDKGVRDSASMTLMYNGHPSIPGLVVPFISSADISIRNLAGEVLLRIGQNSIPDMAAYLQGANDDDLKFIIDILGLIGSTEPVNAILEVLKRTENDNVVLSCIEALGNIGYAEALPDLIEVYDRNELYKPTIIEALGKMYSDEALEFIVSRYQIEDDLTRFSIIESLGLIGNEGTFYFLLSELSKIKGPLIWPIINSLKSLKEKFGFDLPFDESIKNSILYTLLEAEPQYKRAAASMITVFNDKEIMDALLRIFGEDAEVDEYIRPSFYQFADLLYPKLSELIKQKPGNLKHLLWLLKDVTEFDNAESLNRLEPLEKRNLCDAFSMCLDNPDEEIRKSAVELLFYTSLETALLFVDSMIEDDNLWNRLKILEIIENIFHPKINEVLKKMVNDPEEMIRERAAWTLAQRGITNVELKTEKEL